MKFPLPRPQDFKQSNYLTLDTLRPYLSKGISGAPDIRPVIDVYCTLYQSSRARNGPGLRPPCLLSFYNLIFKFIQVVRCLVSVSVVDISFVIDRSYVAI